MPSVCSVHREPARTEYAARGPSLHGSEYFLQIGKSDRCRPAAIKSQADAVLIPANSACRAFGLPALLLPQQFERSLDESGGGRDGVGWRELEPLGQLKLADVIDVELTGLDVEVFTGKQQTAKTVLAVALGSKPGPASSKTWPRS